MSQTYIIQKEALELFFENYAEYMPSGQFDSFKKEMLHLLTTEDRISNAAFMHIAARNGLPQKAWEDFQLQIQTQVSKRTFNLMQRVKNLDSRIENLSISTKSKIQDFKDLNNTRSAIQGI